MRQSRKLGRTATQTLDIVGYGARQILNQRTKQTPSEANDINELKKVVAHSHEVLASATTVLPFLFPDEIVLDRTKITITKRTFFWSLNIISVRIKDVLNVSTSIGPLFGSITIASRVMNSVDHFEIDRFWRSDVIELKQVIQGYLIARQNGISIDHLNRAELITTLQQLGKDR